MKLNDGTVRLKMKDAEMGTCGGDAKDSISLGDGTRRGRCRKGDKRKRDEKGEGRKR